MKKGSAKKTNKTVCMLCSAIGFATTLVANATLAAEQDLEIVVKTAPIVPHGLAAGQPLDVTLSFVDLDPLVPGIPMKKGGSIEVFLPPEVINTGYPVATPGKKTKGCEPPVLARCSSGGMLFGWPQSPVLPLPAIEYKADSHSLLLTSAADAPPYTVETPGVKLIHLFTFGFKNPEVPGDYPISLEIRPDPAGEALLKGESVLKITDAKTPNIAIDTTQSVHIKGPWYKNTMFQTLKPGHTSLNMSSNMWSGDHEPIVGAQIVMKNQNEGELIAQDGAVIGALNIQAPPKATGFYLLSTPSFEAKTGLAGFPTGRLVTALRTAPKVKGEYKVTLSLVDGNSTVHTVRVE